MHKNITGMADESNKNWSKPDFEHHYHRRGYGIDYNGPGTWHVIMRKSPEAPDFGKLAGDPRIPPGRAGCAYIAPSRIGIIIRNEISAIQRRHEILQVYQYQVMPDHIHLLIRLKWRSEDRKLGHYIADLKQAIYSSWRAAIGLPPTDNLPYDIFEENYTDRIIHSGRSLDAVFRYIRENPHRLAMRKLHPEFFSIMRNIEICGEKWQAYGNLFLLRNPFKSAVIVRSAFSEEEKADKRGRWLWGAAHGEVLVSPFISPAEKEIRDEAERLNGKIIHIQHTPFPKRFKPEAHRFAQCTSGQLLILAPMEPLAEERFRHICLHMNRIAEALVVMWPSAVFKKKKTR